ncbi:sensor histidine kinase [Sphingobium sufflavum]|uniref:sensor histidine kinase n=1 Tax=Sphingobium sufflavum TaxID=1129547 RepID=UPI002DD44CC1|nr:HAMP domain-containing sensor histidine kinase [Sphingobium sufflavum]
MIGIAALWIGILLVGGGVGLDRILVSAVTRSFDDGLNYVLTAMISSAEIGPEGEVLFNRPLADQRFLEPASGLYYQISGTGHEDWRSRSLWDRALRVSPPGTTDFSAHDSAEFPGEALRVMQQEVILPGSKTRWIFIVAQARGGLDAQIKALRTTLTQSFAALGIGLVILAALQVFYGIRPLRKIRQEIARMRDGEKARITEPLPREVSPLVDELNGLLDHVEQQAEEARTHAGNLAHALKTPLTVVMNAAGANSPDLAPTVLRETATMRRQIDHHLARARAVGRRGAAQARAQVWPSLEAVERAVSRLYPDTRIDRDGDQEAAVRVERQDLEEMLGNLVENAAKYGGGSVFVTVAQRGHMIDILVEDDGTGIPPAERERIFDRGARLDTGKPGTGLGLAIVRDVAEIYGGDVALDESEDLGGLMVRLCLPRA